MVVSQELYLRVCKDVFGGSVERYGIGEDVTVLTKDTQILKGKIKTIDSTSFSINVESKETVILYDSISNIANNDWLGDEDIRNV